MSLVRRVARPLLAASFIAGGLDTALHPATREQAARPMVDRLAPALGLPPNPRLFVRANGAVMTVAGLLFAGGRLPRVSALALAGTLLPAACADHAFWLEKDPQLRRTQRSAFVRDLGLLGGTLLASVDTSGRPSLAWRGRRAVCKAEKVGQQTRKQARQAAKQVRRATTPTES